MQALFLVPSEVPRWMLTCLMGAPASKNQHQGLYKQGLIPRGAIFCQLSCVPTKSQLCVFPNPLMPAACVTVLK